MKSKEEIIDLIKINLIEIIPELEGETLDLNDDLVNLGANSLDRGELITLTLETLDMEIPRVDFVGAQSIDALAERMHARQN